jgi:phosphomannomutase
MIVIDIAKDFTDEPGARNYSDGPFSGEEFFEKILKPKYLEAKEKNLKLKIILDGTEGYASSFLNEAFIRLGTEFMPDEVWSNLILVSNEIPKYIKKVKESIYEKKK